MVWKGQLTDVGAKRARAYDIIALAVVLIIIVVDQVTKNAIVQHLSPPESQPPIPIIGDYLTIYYVQNNGVAFSLFANTAFLALLIIAAVAIIFYLYFRMLNNGPLAYKVVFGMIIGGAAGNLIDRAIRGGYVVDFIWFRIPQLHYSFAIFNIADASISVGVFLLFVLLLFGGLRRNRHTTEAENKESLPLSSSTSPSVSSNSALHPKEQDAQS